MIEIFFGRRYRSREFFASGVALLFLGVYLLVSEKAKGIFEYMKWGNTIFVSIILFIIGIALILISIKDRQSL